MYTKISLYCIYSSIMIRAAKDRGRVVGGACNQAEGDRQGRGTGRGFLGSGKGGKERVPGPYRLPVYDISEIAFILVKNFLKYFNNYRLPIGSYRLTLCTTRGPFMVDKRVCVPRVTG
jgi:hypothetical protein